MRIFVDDVRNPQDCLGYMHTRIGALNPIYLEEWVIVKNYKQFITAILDCHKSEIEITHISFDHDLADVIYNNEKQQEIVVWHEKTGYDCAKFLKEFYEDNNKELPVMFVHSQNPIGTKNIINLFKNKTMETKDTVEVPKEIMVGLYRIMCGISSNFSDAEVYDEAKQNMTDSLKWVIEYGEKNNIDSRGSNEHKTNK